MTGRNGGHGKPMVMDQEDVTQGTRSTLSITKTQTRKK